MELSQEKKLARKKKEEESELLKAKKMHEKAQRIQKELEQQENK